jgi:hypothetical protein
LAAFVCAFSLVASASDADVDAAAKAVDISLSLNPRFDGFAGSGRELGRRSFIKAQGLLQKGPFTLSAEGFAEHDFADTQPLGAPELRRSRDTGYLQEAYIDWNLGSVFVRAGRQPVRWSQSWTVPSLDVFTGRRWNRLFVDPLSEQLVHPDGVLFSYASAAIEAELFQVVRPAENIMPQPYPLADRKQESQTGFRVKTSVRGFDLALITYHKPDETMIGGSANYAFDRCVIKTEMGQGRDKRRFVMAGADFFLGDLTLSPQLTWFQDPVLTNNQVEQLAYAPLKYTYERWSFELQYYRNLQSRDEFSGLLIAREFGQWLETDFKISTFAQSYAGEPGRLFGTFQKLTGGTVYGARLDLNYSL